MTIPVNLAGDGAKTPYYMLRHHSPEAAAMPRTRHQEVRVSSFSLQYLVKLTGVSFFPVHAKAMASSLTFFRGSES